MPESIGKMQALQTLFLGNCFNIPQLPANIVNLKSLVTLNLYNCGALTFLHDNFHQAASLRILSLQGCEKLKEVPPSLAQAPSLTTLSSSSSAAACSAHPLRDGSRATRYAGAVSARNSSSRSGCSRDSAPPVALHSRVFSVSSGCVSARPLWRRSRSGPRSSSCR